MLADTFFDAQKGETPDSGGTVRRFRTTVFMFFALGVGD